MLCSVQLLQWCIENLYQETQQVLLIASSTLLQLPYAVLIVGMFPGVILICANWQSPRKSLGNLQGAAKVGATPLQTVRHGTHLE